MGRNRAAVVGYNSEANFFANHPLSGFPGIGDAVSCTSDVGRRQNTRINNMAMLLPANVAFLSTQCRQFQATDGIFLIGTTPDILAAMLDPCPCTLQQAARDIARFTRLNENCYVSSLPINHQLRALGGITLTQMCCYVNG